MKVSSARFWLTASVMLLMIGGINNNNRIMIGVESAALFEALLRVVQSGILLTVVAIPYVVCNRGCYRYRNLREEIAPIWITAKESCSTVDYDMTLVVETQTGHLQLLATPSTTAAVRVDEEVCFAFVVHAIENLDMEDMDHVEQEEEVEEDDDIEHYKILVEKVPKDQVDLFWDSRESYDLGVARSFGDIAYAIETVRVMDDEIAAAYLNSMVPKNCATYLLELGKTLQIPIDKAAVSFVLTNLQGTSFMESFTMTGNLNDQVTAGKDWLLTGSGQDHDSNEEQAVGTSNLRGLLGDDVNTVDPDNMLHRLSEFMLQQHYPSELLRT